MVELKQTLLFFYDYFYPGYKAGGPIQSLTNLAIALESDYQIKVITSAFDLHETKPYTNITLNNWNEVNIPGSHKPLSVFYADKTLGTTTFKELLKDADPSVVYFNNIYSSLFFRQPLAAVGSLRQKPKVVICPRGMLQKGALAVKPFKKKVYLTYLRYTGAVNNSFWHATNEEEAADIRKHFPTNRGVIIASNIPKPPYSQITFPAKKAGDLRLVYLSLIAEKKNLLWLLQVLQQAPAGIVLDIYGPVTDAGYWQQCEALIAKMPARARYKGDVQPAKVQEVLAQYHALILLTKGENFGHALYESLSVGRPVITSYFTPWNELHQKSAGVNADIGSMPDCLSKLALLADLDQTNFTTFCEGAHQVAMQYYTRLDTDIKYRQLFS